MTDTVELAAIVGRLRANLDALESIDKNADMRSSGIARAIRYLRQAIIWAEIEPLREPPGNE